MTKTIWRCLWFLLLGFSVAGCAHKQYQFEYSSAESQAVWPVPPEVPKIRFLGFITGEQNFVEDKSQSNIFNKTFDWLGNFIFGAPRARTLYRPQGILVDAQQKELYVTDIGSKAVFVFDFVGNTLKVWDQVDELTKFSAPIGIAKNNNNEIFVSDSALGYVTQLDSEGKPLAKWGSGILQRPTGLAYDSLSKMLFVADAALHKIFVFAENGELAFQIGEQKGEANGLFNSPTYLTVANQRLFVADTLNSRVQIFDVQGKWLSSFGGRGMYVGNLPRPKGIAVDSENHIYVVESYYDHLLIFNEDGVPLLPIGGNGKVAGQFNLPAGASIDQQDRIYVADMFNSRISVFQYLKQ